MRFFTRALIHYTHPTSRVNLFAAIFVWLHLCGYVNYYHKALRLGCCSSPRSASANVAFS